MKQQVFYDPEQARWKLLRRLLDAAGIATMLLVIFFVYSALKGEHLPELLLPSPKHSYRGLRETEKQKARERRKLLAHRGHRKTKSAPSTVELNNEEGIRAAFYVPWDASSFSSLREYARQIDLLFPEWLSVITPDGHLQSVDPQTNQFFDVVQGTTIHPVDDRVMPFLKSEDTGTEVFPLVNNFDGTNWIDISAFLKDPNARGRFRQQIAEFLNTNKYRGIMMDFEDFPPAVQPQYLELLRELASDLHSKGMKLYVSVYAHNITWDYRGIASVADGIVVMNYDEHYPEGPPGPVASQDWFVNNLKYLESIVPKDKLICSIGNFGYDWATKPKNGKMPAGEANKMQTVQEAWLTARDSEADIDFDYDSLNPHISYLDEKNVQHDIWYLDAVTALNEMRAAQGLGIKTFALWRLGSEDRSLWQIWDLPQESNAPDKLKDVPPGQDVDMEGAGEILRIADRPSHGSRTLTIDPDTRLIGDENFDTLPEPYRVDRYGASNNSVAITFDDGPDPTWTPKILDVLKREHATATFFLIGIQAEKYSDVAQRVYREGNSIGNHTFTHPDISNFPHSLMKLELNLTDLLFASRIGVRTLLMRPPYSIDAEPDTEDQVAPLEFSQNMGYITVGDKIDPNDWRDVPRRFTADEIADNVLSHLPPCKPNDIHCGNIILMHDGGGNRQQTVLALPKIIEGIRAKGLQIVPVYELIGKTKADVMPPLSASERWKARFTLIGFLFIDFVIKGITWIFLIGDVLMTGRLLFVGAFAIFDRVRKRQFSSQVSSENGWPKVAVLIPAYNEEKVIQRTIAAALNSDYRNLRVIVIDDGSSDKTLQVARNAFQSEQASGRVLILSKVNAGKAEALNFGLQHVANDEEIFVGIDADTIIAHDAVGLLVRHFFNPAVGAVAGNAKVGNRMNLWTRWQALEYITSQNFERRALNVLGAVSVVPGALGAWRTSAVRECAGYHTDTVAEDADLTMALLQHGYRVEYEDLALAYTEAPVNANGLMRQRFRWSFGILQSVWKHRSAFTRKGVLGWVALPNIIVFQILLPLVSPFIDLMFVYGTISYYVSRYFHPESADATSFHRLVLFFVAFLVIDFITSAIAFALERRQPEAREDVALLSQVWLQRFAYRQLFSVVLFKTLKRAVEGQAFSWDKLERTAAVSYQPSEKHDSVEV